MVSSIVIEVNSLMSTVKVTRYSSLMKIVIVQNFQTLISPVFFLKEKGLRYQLSSILKQKNSFQKHKFLYPYLYNFIDSVYFSVFQTHIQNMLKRLSSSEWSFQSRIQRVLLFLGPQPSGSPLSPRPRLPVPFIFLWPPVQIYFFAAPNY